MITIQKITIAHPCQQSWLEMTKNTEGRYCDHCSKTVIDFESMTDAHLIAYLTTHSHVCGKIGESQLERLNQQLKNHDAPPKINIKKSLMTMALLGSTVLCKVNGQNTPDTLTKVKQSLSGNYSNNYTSKKTSVYNRRKREIKGRICDESDSPLYGATVKVLGTSITFATDTDGRFKVKAPMTAERLTVSFVGFETKTVGIDSLQNNGTIKMTTLVTELKNTVVINGNLPYNYRKSILGGVIVVSHSAPVKRRSWLWRVYYKYIRTPIHNIFY